MRQPIRHGGAGRANIGKGNNPLQLMVASLVEDVAKPDYAGGFSGKVNGQSSGAAGEKASYGVEFPAATLEIGVGDSEIGCGTSGHAGEENLILPVPEFVTWRLWQFCRGNHLHDWSRLRCFRGQQQRKFLRESRRREYQ